MAVEYEQNFQRGTTSEGRHGACDLKIAHRWYAVGVCDDLQLPWVLAFNPHPYLHDWVEFNIP